MAEIADKKSWESHALLEDCVGYFKERPVYQRLFGKLREKYAGLGRFGGRVTLTGLTKEEKAQLGGFLQKDYTENKTVTVSAALLERALADSRFASLTWEEILGAYFGEPLLVNSQERARQEQEREEFFRCLMQEYSVSGKCSGQARHALGWLEAVLSQRLEGYLFLMQRYREDADSLSDLLANVLAAIDSLPCFWVQDASMERVLLPVFAARQTGDPHYFDVGTPGERLLGAFLHYQFSSRLDGESAAEQRNRLFYEAGILRDDLSNDTLAYGIHGVCMDGSVHEGIEGFFCRKEPLRLTLRTLGNLRGASGTKRIYVVENPAVFSTIVMENPRLTVICGNGQPRLATLVLMDYLLQSGSSFYYAGDFDAEGLAIAQRLKNRYGERLALWGYVKDWYVSHLSGVCQEEARLKKLEQVCTPGLLEIKEEMQRQKQAAYQEQMLPELLESLRQLEGSAL